MKIIHFSNICDYGISVKESVTIYVLIMMITKLKHARAQFTAIFVMIVVLLIFASVNVETSLSDETSGELDLFTEKKPHDGKGPNMSSDAFAPEEEVRVYAYASYRNCPLENVAIAFEIKGPSNPFQNFSFYRTAFTNRTGIAAIDFRISRLNGTTFGEWNVIGNAKVGNLIIKDVLSFEVNWIVAIVSVQTIGENYTCQKTFIRGGLIGIAVDLRNIAMTKKTITLSIAIFDSLNVLINSTEITEFELPGYGVLVHIYNFMRIPKSAHVGEAVVRASAYTTSLSQGGLPYCPEISERFLITDRDIVVLSVHLSSNQVYVGETVNIFVTVKNQGWESESFNVFVYRNETVISESPVSDLQSRSNTTLGYVWDTSHVAEGFFQIAAYAEPVPGEISTENNLLADGFVEVREPVHDVTVLNVTPSSDTTYIGQPLDIEIVLRNEGSYVESFNVTVYCDYPTKMGKLFVSSLQPSCVETLVFRWNTEDVPEGNYTLSALAEPVADEEDTADNYFEDGIVEVRAAPMGWFVPCWFWWLVVLLILLLVLLVVGFYYRRKRKKTEEAFYSGWTAWYYCHDLQNRTHKT